jgi:hypothetical protein
MSAATSTRIAAGVTTAYLRDLARRPAPAMSARARRRGEGSAFRAPDFTRDISDAPLPALSGPGGPHPACRAPVGSALHRHDSTLPHRQSPTGRRRGEQFVAQQGVRAT